MAREIISTDQAPAAIGTYSQAVKVGNTVLSIGSDPVGARNHGNDRRRHRSANSSCVFDNLSAVAAAAGGSLADIAKLNIFLTDLGNFAKVNEVMAEYFQQPYPAKERLLRWRDCHVMPA